MPTFKTRTQILEIIKDKNHKVITIDGPTGSGKSKLATFLSKEFNTPAIHLDKYLNKSDKDYYKELDFDEISKDLRKRKILIIEGILMLEVIKKLKIKSDIAIFCTDNEFIDEWNFYIDSEMSFESIIKERINNLNVIRDLENKKKLQKLDRFHYELDKYIFDYIPFENSDILYNLNSDLVD